MIDVGYKPSQLKLVTRNPQKLDKLKERFGFQTCQVDLDYDDDDDDDNTFSSSSSSFSSKKLLSEALADCVGCYIHSTSSDTRKLDTAEEKRARNLAKVIQNVSLSCHVVYNSAAGELDHGVKRIQQKQDVERIFLEEYPDIPFTSLRANLFMEELWKSYTRPSILEKGKFPFSTTSDRKIYLTSVRDMVSFKKKTKKSVPVRIVCKSFFHSLITIITILKGRIAGTCIAQEMEVSNIINIAGDVLSAEEIASAFATAQNKPCKHSQGKIFGLISRLFFRDLYEVIRFYRHSTEMTDIPALTSKFQGYLTLTDFASFLKETEWGNTDRTFDTFSDCDEIQLT